MKLIEKIKRNIQFRKKQKRIEDIGNSLFPKKIVYSGPFKDLKYKDFSSHGSSIYAKLLGSYEAELHDFVNLMISSDLDYVVDVGCAEGYYAVGFALKLKDIKVHAFDISEYAQKLCKDMSILNDVSNKVIIKGEVNKNFFLNLPKDKKGLIIFDCEGAESELIDEKVLNHLSNCNFMVELHEFIVRGIENKLIRLFENSHNTKIIESVDDYRRPDRWPLPILKNIAYQDQLEFYKEGRPGLMKWVCAVPLQKK